MEKVHRARIVIADDHILFAEACKRLLEPEFQVVGIFPDGRSLVQSVLELRPDVVLLDISMPELNGLDAGEQIKQKKSAIKLIYMTQAIGPDVAAEAFRRGASGYLLSIALPKNSELLFVECCAGSLTCPRSSPKIRFSIFSGRRLPMRKKSIFQVVRAKSSSCLRKASQ